MWVSKSSNFEQGILYFFLNKTTALQFYTFRMFDLLPMTFCQLLCVVAKQEKVFSQERSKLQQSIPILTNH